MKNITHQVVMVFVGVLIGGSQGLAFSEEESPVETVLDEIGVEEGVPTLNISEQRALFESLPYNPVDYRGAEELSLDPAYVHGIREGLELVYLRDYEGAQKHFRQLDRDFEGSVIRFVAETLIVQAKMLENFDFRYEKEYWEATAKARKHLDRALETPGRDAFEHFMSGGIIGIEAIHRLRKGKYLVALQLAFEAMGQIQETRVRAPEFTDLKFADGMYNYWRTVVTDKSPLLPSFGDKREEGLSQIKSVEAAGIFLGPPATLALVFSYLEEKDKRAALTACLRNKRAYPDNIINNLTTATTYVVMRKPASAQPILESVLALESSNQRGKYWLGVVLLMQKLYPEAEAMLMSYLNSGYMEDYQQASAHYRLGQLYRKQKNFDESEKQFRKAIKLTGHKSSKAALESLLKNRKKDR